MTEVSGLISMQTMQIAGQLKLTKLLQMKKLQLKLLKQKIAVKAIRTMPKIRQKKSSRVFTYISRGGEYEVINFATHSETGEKLVIYRNLHNTSEVWARPVEMFAEKS